MRESVLSIVRKALAARKVRTTATFATVALSIVLEVLPPLVLAKAVDALMGGRGVSLALAAAYFLLQAGCGLTGAVREAMIVSTGESITHALRSAMRAKLRRLPASYFTTHASGRTCAIQVNDVDAVEALCSSGLFSMLSDLGTVCAIVVVVLARSRGLGLLLVCALPLLALFTRFVQKRLLAAHLAFRKASARASGMLPETLRVIRSLHVYHAETFARRRYDRAIDGCFHAMERTNRYDAVYSPVIALAEAVAIAVLMGCSGQSGALRAWFGMSVGTAVALIAYVHKVFTPLSAIGMEIQTVQAAVAGWKRVQEFLDEPEEPFLPVQVPDPSVPDAIEVDGASFSYLPGRTVLSRCSLRVPRGTFVTLTGRTGAGKTTLFKLLLGLYAPDAGVIRIDSIDPRRLAASERRRTIACVQQGTVPVPGTIRDQVTLGNPTYRDADTWRALDTVGLAPAIRALPSGLDAPYEDRNFSQGQRQLLMIARALVSDPDILLLDEITADLDSGTERLVIEALRRASAHRTVLSISHRLSEVLPGRVLSIG